MEILDGIRFVHGINKRDVYKWCADRLMKKYGYVELLVLHHRYVAFMSEQHQLIIRARDYNASREFNRRKWAQKDKGVYTQLFTYDGEHDDRM